ncbi:MAG: hypothetical protein N2Z79_01775, partial [Candidatus Omnitrophica bacterium]|nr:hypothetical protein [Candidatus Omnitrophota bacterium]
NHILSLITLVYIKYQYQKYYQAKDILNSLLKRKDLSRNEKGMILLLLGFIKSKEIAKAGLFNKIINANSIKDLFKKAVVLAPDLPETHLGLGTFYLFAPRIIGGDIRKAKKHLEIALKIAPNFATAYARLAQVYKKEGDFNNYRLYLEKAKRIDPENEVVNEEMSKK